MVYVCKDSSLELNRQIFRTKNSSFNKYLTVCKVNLELHLIYKRSKVKYSDREKDKALASYYNGAACADEDLTAMLKDDGYIVRQSSFDSFIIIYLIVL